jgi:3-oxoacyl-[acyl-carrier protein] reductase
MRNVIVTGGSRGLGLGIVRALLSSGYRVIAVARSESSELSALLSEANSSVVGSLIFRAFDLGDIEKIPDFAASVRKEHGPIYGLVNNAGISFEGMLATMQYSQIEQLIRINVLSPIMLTKHIVRGMMSAGQGRIVNMLSIMAFTGYSGLSVYGATKSSLLGFSRSLARELGPTGINVNSVAPGFIDTDLTKRLDEKAREKVIRRSALHRLAEVNDVANAVEFFLSDKAKNITGTVITVDAGSTA